MAAASPHIAGIGALLKAAHPTWLPSEIKSAMMTTTVDTVDDAAATYTASVDLAGFDVTVTPSEFTLAPGAEQEFTVEITRTDAPLGEWVSGHLSWTGVGHTVRSPMAVQAVTVSAPSEVHADISAAGSAEVDVIAGFDGTLDPTLNGLIGVTPIVDSVVTGPFDINNPVADGAATKVYEVEVAEGTLAARFSVDSADDTADLDLYVYLEDEEGDLHFVNLSASGAADEEVTLLSPEAGTYHAFVNGFTTPGGSTQYGIANFVVPPGDLANSDIQPDTAPVTVGETVTFTASWTGLDTAMRWLGVITYAGTTVDGPVSSDTTTILSLD